MVRCFLTTFDNPYSPYEQFEEWYRYDTDHGYNSSGLLDFIGIFIVRELRRRLSQPHEKAR